jgi:chemotaxis protein CheC
MSLSKTRSRRKMIGRQVLLSVPSVEIVSQRDAARLIKERESNGLVAVRQDFEGAFSGRALLILPDENSRQLVRAVTGDELTEQEVTEIEREALAETGNVILNGCLATMANMLKRSLSMTVPEVIRGQSGTLLESAHFPTTENPVLFLYINFSVRERDVRGYIAMVMDLPSMIALKGLIQDFIERVMQEDA